MRQFKYRAFLSYSHADKKAAVRLHRNLERYRTPAALLRNGHGQLTRSLRPIFRDRDDAGAGHSLNEVVAQALEDSSALIVLCSPNSAKSPYVDEEIRTFKRLDRQQRIFPIILSGEPGSADAECFPAALRERIGPEGSPIARDIEPLAADMRSEGDGSHLAELKVIASLLGVDVDALRRREEIERRKRQGMWAGIALAMTTLAVVSLVSLALMVQWKEAEAAARLEADASRAAAQKSADAEKAMKIEAQGARDDATAALVLAEERLQQLYELTLRTVITEAQARRLTDGNFYASIIDAKNQVEWFQRFLLSYREKANEDEVYVDLARALVRLAIDTPEGLGTVRDRIAWASHAREVLERRSETRPELRQEIQDVSRVISRLRMDL